MKRRSFLALLFASAARPVWAQPSKRRQRIAIVIAQGDTARTKPPEMDPLWSAFFEKLASRGYREGENLSVERFTAESRSERHAELVRTVVATKPDVILAFSGRLARHFKAATATIPIVVRGGHLIELEVVDNLAKPGGNITGVSTETSLEFHVKTLDYLRLVASNGSRIGVLVPRELWESDHIWSPKREAARQTGLTLVPALLDPPVDEAEVRRALAEISDTGVDGLFPVGTPEVNAHIHFIIAWANEKRVPTTYPLPVHVRSGGLMSYSPDVMEAFSHLAEQVAMVLRGANPGDIPIYQPARFRLVINLATAREQEIDIPPLLLAAATDVIE